MQESTEHKPTKLGMQRKAGEDECSKQHFICDSTAGRLIR